MRAVQPSPLQGIIQPRAAVDANLSFLLGYRCARDLPGFLACTWAAPRPTQSGVRPAVTADRGPLDPHFDCMLVKAAARPTGQPLA